MERAEHDVEVREELRAMFETDIDFGTAGLRAAMRPGFACMNYITVQLATQGVTEYLLRLASDDITVIVGHDHRHQSREFALLTASVLRFKGIRVHILWQPHATPLVPFAIGQLGANFGIMITASHNPATDNGYKVYAGNGCQIVSPTDREIASLIRGQKYTLWPIHKESIQDETSAFHDRITREYVSEMRRFFSGLPQLARPEGFPLKAGSIVYTPMHGVGWSLVHVLLSSMGLLSVLDPVPSQVLADPAFPTCAFPNPEEGVIALAQAISYAEQQGSNLIFANDPDADRFNFAERETATSGSWKIFTGNEIAALFADYLWRHCKLINAARLAPVKEGEKDRPRSYAMLNSCVSSKFLLSMGQKEGFTVVETLTGFKHLANKARQLEQPEESTSAAYQVLLAYEEAIGFMVGNGLVWDKDGVSALALALCLVAECREQGISLRARLHSLYDKYGYFVQYNSYYRGRVGDFNRIFARAHELLKINTKDGTVLVPPDGQIQISKFECTGSTMITLHLDREGFTWITLRASGTEPKIKFYSELRTTLVKEAASREHLKLLVTNVCNWLLDPSSNQLSGPH